MDPVRIARPGRQKVRNEQVDALVQKIGGLFNERAQRNDGWTCYQGNDLDQRHYPIAAHMSHDHWGLFCAR